VVVKDVPAGATAAGIPARILDEARKTTGFNAYGLSTDQNDPVAKALHGLIGHSVTVTSASSISCNNSKKWAYAWKTNKLPPISSIPTT